jgi:hypothetical protein
VSEKSTRKSSDYTDESRAARYRPFFDHNYTVGLASPLRGVQFQRIGGEKGDARLELRGLQRRDKDEGIESEQREGRDCGVEGVANAKARDHGQEHHQGESRGGESKQRKIEVACKKSEAASDLQHSGQGAEAGDSIPFELDNHLLGEEAA